MQFEETKKCRN